MFNAISKNSMDVEAVVTRRNGKTFNLGKVNQRWTPRLWLYRFIIFKFDRLKENI